MENRNMFVGLDVHKETIDVSIAEGHRDGEVRHYGVIASDLEPLDKVVRALRAPDRRLHFVYEAGPAPARMQGCHTPYLGSTSRASAAQSSFSYTWNTARCTVGSLQVKLALRCT